MSFIFWVVFFYLSSFHRLILSASQGPEPHLVHSPYLQPEGPVLDGCQCAGGIISTYPYENIPLANTGAGCIGGCGGSRFEVHDYATTVSQLKAWTGGDHNGLTCLFVQLFNGQTFTQGQMPARGPDSSIQFSLGETIVGNIELCGNGIGTRTGYIRFSTSGGQQFKVGDEHTPYYFPSNNAFLTGFFGQSGDEIDHLGILLMKTISSGQLLNVNYPSLSTYTLGLSPHIYSQTLCNDDYHQDQTTTISFQETTGTSYKWSISVSFTIGGSISVSAGLPEVAQVTSEFHWEVGITSSYEISVDTTKSETMTFPATVPPRERLYATYTWWDSECDVPYTATLQYTFTDGTVYNFTVSDRYTGAYITNAIGSFHSVPLKVNETCPTTNKYLSY